MRRVRAGPAPTDSRWPRSMLPGRVPARADDVSLMRRRRQCFDHGGDSRHDAVTASAIVKSAIPNQSRSVGGVGFPHAGHFFASLETGPPQSRHA